MAVEGEKTILICDPGVDDGLGLMLALASHRELSLLGVCAVAGNGPAPVCGQNALDIMEAFGKAVPVYLGERDTLEGPLSFEETGFTGAGALSGNQLKRSPRHAEKEGAEAFIIRMARAYPGLKIICTAPFTALAGALMAAPDIQPLLGEVITSSGYYGVGEGGVKGRCSWNLSTDPAAARVVFNSGIAIKAAGIDVAALLTEEMAASLLAKARPGFAKGLLETAAAFNHRQGLLAASLLVDGMAVALGVNSRLAVTTSGCVQVAENQKTDENFCRLQSAGIVQGNVSAAHHFNYNGYLQLLLDRVLI